jgi:hypothetical protein
MIIPTTTFQPSPISFPPILRSGFLPFSAIACRISREGTPAAGCFPYSRGGSIRIALKLTQSNENIKIEGYLPLTSPFAFIKMLNSGILPAENTHRAQRTLRRRKS